MEPQQGFCQHYNAISNLKLTYKPLYVKLKFYKLLVALVNKVGLSVK